MIVLATALALLTLAGPGYADFNSHLSIDTAHANPGEQFTIRVRLHDNDMAFATMMVPIRYDSEYLTLDSVSYIGSIKPYNFTGFDYDFDELGVAQISYIPPIAVVVPAIHTSGGTFAEMTFTVAADAPAGFLPVDSANIDSVFFYDGVEKHLWIKAVMSDSTGNESHYPVCAPGGVQVGSPTDVDQGTNDLSLPTEYALSQNYPNPFNPTTTIAYALPETGRVKLEVFNILGQEVSTLVDEIMPAGSHEVVFDASAVPSGIYFYRLTHDGYSDTKKMALVK